MNIGERIRDTRIKAKWTQQDLASKLGVTPALIGQYERGERNPKVETLKKIASALNVSFETLLDTPYDQARRTEIHEMLGFQGFLFALGYEYHDDCETILYWSKEHEMPVEESIGRYWLKEIETDNDYEIDKNQLEEIQNNISKYTRFQIRELLASAKPKRDFTKEAP